MSKKILREYANVLEREGLEQVQVEKSKRGHVKVVGRWQGKIYVGTAAWTPSDVRNMLNMRGDVRRWKRSAVPNGHPQALVD